MFCTCRMLPLRSFPVVSAEGSFGARLAAGPPCCRWTSRSRAWMHHPDHADPPVPRAGGQGITILMSTHDMLAARESCSRLCGVRGSSIPGRPGGLFSLEHARGRTATTLRRRGSRRTGFTCAGGVG